ncbi:methylated-DNA--protein-cysteine methyltransferase [Lysinibacillus alkalisoli]|uniref:Methylated-DNA--protein-cysteine methyltransferase n=1 Tax=Lysinibacillus alkalisoli TaxID=1911548 RepID=A0A917LI85_9BACI|nr:methylated-DNA--[protein]-cysteine S-methyltransferase [Lysinibacillus alkalisoli]GGG25752.1 methylated-DNA--protein-cysteine methyltransferase [Lysinibacillus alkalisoli]
MKKTYETKIGLVLIEANDEAIQAVTITDEPVDGPENEWMKKGYQQLSEYLEGKRQQFDLPLQPQGTAFQQKVWQALKEIPFGETRTYKEVATAIGNVNASRAVGNANNKNPILIIVPCHRVIGANGKLVGYGAGLPLKEQLLTLEGAK